MSRSVDVVRTYLELREPSQLRSGRSDDPALRVALAVDCTPSFYRYLYGEVGRAYHWRDRTRWTDDELRAHLSRPAVSVWVLARGATPAGWFELVRHEDGAVEIAYFGLIPEFVGGGIGKHLLTEAAEQAWKMGATRVWLHTCTLDSPAALPNYLARGFTPFREERYTTVLD